MPCACPCIALPTPDAFLLEEVVPGEAGLVVTLRLASGSARCPMCGQTSRRVQSRYTRRLADLPCGGRAVLLRVAVRRFRCDQPACHGKIFAKRLGPLADPYARRTTRLGEHLRLLGLACGGELGARLARHAGLVVSATSLLRLVRATPTPADGTPRVVGVDDFAWRRGVRYGTLLCDLERHAPLAVLPDASAGSFAAWLRAHPGVAVLSRDRSGAYADGGRQGAPSAEQVADRWHLLKNLGDALEQVLSREYHALVLLGPAGVPEREAADLVAGTPPPPVPPVTPRAARRRAQFARVGALHATGYPIRAIAREVGIARNTVRAYLQWAWRGQEPGRRPRGPRPSLLDPYREELVRRWEAGCQNGRQLFDELRALGYRGHASLVKVAVARLRRGLPPRPPAPPKLATPRQLRWLLLRRRKDLDHVRIAELDLLLAHNPRLRPLHALAQDFGALLRERCLARLEPWLQRAAASGMPELRSFVWGVERDYTAVANALCLPWSQGQVEGQITRLKLLKRAMYGRAKTDLLQQRVLHPV